MDDREKILNYLNPESKDFFYKKIGISALQPRSFISQAFSWVSLTSWKDFAKSYSDPKYIEAGKKYLLEEASTQESQQLFVEFINGIFKSDKSVQNLGAYIADQRLSLVTPFAKDHFNNQIWECQQKEVRNADKVQEEQDKAWQECHNTTKKN